MVRSHVQGWRRPERLRWTRLVWCRWSLGDRWRTGHCCWRWPAARQIAVKSLRPVACQRLIQKLQIEPIQPLPPPTPYQPPPQPLSQPLPQHLQSLAPTPDQQPLQPQPIPHAPVSALAPSHHPRTLCAEPPTPTGRRSSTAPAPAHAIPGTMSATSTPRPPTPAATTPAPARAPAPAHAPSHLPIPTAMGRL